MIPGTCGWRFSHEHRLFLGDLLICTFDDTNLLSFKVFSISHYCVFYDDLEAAGEEENSQVSGA
jgi:hypothetical protein